VHHGRAQAGRGDHVLNVLMMNVACIAVVGLVWALGGFGLTFGDDAFLGADVRDHHARADLRRGFTQLARQAIAAGAVGLYSFVVTLVIGYLITVTIGFRVRPESEAGGLDLNEHAETGYELGSATGSGRDEDTGPLPPVAELTDAQVRALERHLERILPLPRRSGTSVAPPPWTGDGARERDRRQP
jgi:hypothetical protein